MQQSNLPHSSLLHIDLIALLSPKGLPLHPSASRQRLRDSLLQTRRAVLGVCRGVTLSPSESQATRGHGEKPGGGLGGHRTVARHADGSLDSIALSWLSLPSLLATSFTEEPGEIQAPLQHSASHYSSCSSMRDSQRGPSGRQIPPPTPPRASNCDSHWA